MIRRPLPRTRALVGAGLVCAGLVAGLVAGCAPAPSGRLDTAPATDLPSAAPAGPPAVADLPTFDPSTTVGTYAPGFPADLLPVPAGATVLASSARPAEDGLTSISLSLTSKHTAAQVLDQLGGPLAKAGFTQTTPQAKTGLTAQTAWTRQTPQADDMRVETLLIGALDDGGLCHVSVSGMVQAKPS